MKIRFGKVGYPLYRDAGPYEGQMRVDLSIRPYLSPEEYARYEGSESLQITLHESGGGDPSPTAPLKTVVHSERAECLPKRDPRDLAALIRALKGAVCKTVGSQQATFESPGYEPLPNPAV